MSDELEDKKKELAATIGKRRAAADRPNIKGGGMVGEVLNAISDHIPPRFVQLGLVVFLGYHAWDYYARAQQMVADVQTKNAEAREAEVEADAINQKMGLDSAAVAKMKAELTQLQAAAQLAEADAKSQAQKIGDGTARLAMLRAEISAARNEAIKIQATVDGLKQTINGMSLNVAQKKNEIEAAEINIEQKIWIEHLKIEGMKRGDWRTYTQLGPLLGGRNWQDDGIKKYTVKDMFNELHTMAGVGR